jgi:hypothetical protein
MPANMSTTEVRHVTAAKLSLGEQSKTMFTKSFLVRLKVAKLTPKVGEAASGAGLKSVSEAD